MSEGTLFRRGSAENTEGFPQVESASCERPTDEDHSPEGENANVEETGSGELIEELANGSVEVFVCGAQLLDLVD